MNVSLFPFQIKVKCGCGHLSASRPCGETNGAFSRLQMSMLANHMSSIQGGSSSSSVDLAQIMKGRELECVEECAQVSGSCSCDCYNYGI